MTTTSIGHKPDGQWEFDEQVTICFDDMLERSIPQYREMRQSCAELVSWHASMGTVVDIGCSRGGAIASCRPHCGADFVGLEVSAPMLEAARQRFDNAPDVRIIEHDLRKPFTAKGLGIENRVESVLSILTLQFTPIEHRLRILSDVYDMLSPGGAFILVEKVLGANARVDAVMVDRYYAMKRRNGYSEDEIQRKRLALEGRLVPVTAQMNESLLRSAGFEHLDCFWRWMNFAGWIALKGR